MRYIYKYLFFIIAISSFSVINAQNNLIGKVLNKNQIGLYLVNIAFLNQVDSTLVTGAVSY